MIIKVFAAQIVVQMCSNHSASPPPQTLKRLSPFPWLISQLPLSGPHPVKTSRLSLLHIHPANTTIQRDSQWP